MFNCETSIENCDDVEFVKVIKRQIKFGQFLSSQMYFLTLKVGVHFDRTKVTM